MIVTPLFYSSPLFQITNSLLSRVHDTLGFPHSNSNSYMFQSAVVLNIFISSNATYIQFSEKWEVSSLGL